MSPNLQIPLPRIDASLPRRPFAVTAQTRVSTGNGNFDSYNSTDASYSTNGAYDSLKRKAGAYLIISASNAYYSASNGATYGYVFAGLGSTSGGSLFGASGLVGDLSYGLTGYQTGHFQPITIENNTFNAPTFPLLSSPTALTVNKGVFTITASAGVNDYTIASYGTSSIRMTGSTATTAVRIIITGSAMLANTGLSNPYNGIQMKLYVSGNFYVAAAPITTTFPKNIVIFVPPASTVVTFASTAPSVITTFTLDAPSSDVTNNMSNNTDWSHGYILCKSLTVANSVGVHYDEGATTTRFT